VSGLAQVGAIVGALGLAAVVVAPARGLRLVGLVGLAAGCAALAVSLSPGGDLALWAVVLAAAAALACLFVRLPPALALVALAAVPFRFDVSLDGGDVSLPLPLYAVVAGAALTLAWQLAHGDGRVRELGLVGWPLALLVAWTGVSFAWSGDERQGAILLLCFVLPFGLLAVALARLPWSEDWAAVLYVEVAVVALVLAGIGGWQYVTRDIVWSPGAVVGAARAPAGWFYRVDPAFDDASLYGRFLVVAIVAGLVVVLLRRGRIALVAGAVVAVTWLGLLPSFSQASFAAFAAASAVVLVAAWWRRAALAAALVVCFLLGAAITVETAREPAVATAVGARSQLVSNAVELAVDHPVVGVGAGGFAHAYAERLESARAPGERAARNAPVTVAAELGAVGFALLAWLAAVALVVAFRGARTALRLAPAVALVAILVHSLLYDALFQDPMFWGLLGLVTATARVSAAPPAATGRTRRARVGSPAWRERPRRSLRSRSSRRRPSRSPSASG